MSNYSDGTVSVINGSDHQVIATVPVGALPRQIAIDPSTHRVYVADLDPVTYGGQVSVIDGSPGAGMDHVSTIALSPDTPVALALDSTTHNLYAVGFITGVPHGNVYIVDESGDSRNGTVVADIRVGRDPEGVAVDPSTHAVYVTDLADGTVTVVGQPTDVSLSVTGPASAADGTHLTETVTVTDHGPAAATGTVTDLLVPAGLSVDFAPGASYHSQKLVWTDSLVPGTSVTHQISLTVGPDVHATVTIGRVTICPDPYDRDLGNNAAVTSIRLG